MQPTFLASVGAVVIFSTVGIAAQQRETLGAARPAVVAKTHATAPTAAVSAAASRTPRILPGTRLNIFTTIQGNALNSTNGVLPNAPVRLRDVRFGRTVEVSTTDKAGLFAFRSVDPGTYVVELIDNDQTTLAASQILYVDAGQTVSTLVKLPFRIPPFGGFFGHTVGSAIAVASAAAASGVLATAVTGAEASANGKPIIR